MSKIREHASQIENKDQSAIRLLDPATEEEAIRTAHTFQVNTREKCQSATADVQILTKDPGKIEGVGYIRNGRELLLEFSTDEATAPDCHVENYNGEVILEGRDFEPEGKLP